MSDPNRGDLGDTLLVVGHRLEVIVLISLLVGGVAASIAATLDLNVLIVGGGAAAASASIVAVLIKPWAPHRPSEIDPPEIG